MRILDFVSVSPKLNIFKERANKTNLGGTLFLIYILVLIFLGVIYLFDYFLNDKYDFNFNIVKTEFKDQKFKENKIMNSMLNTNLEFYFMLSKGLSSNPKRDIYNNNFIIIDTEKLYDKLINYVQRDEADGYLILNSNENENTDDCILEQEHPYTMKAGDLHLAVLYRCNGLNCTIREEDKKHYFSYSFFLGYKGFNLEHQNPEKPIQPLPDNNYWIETVPFFTEANIAYLNWELIEYEEKQGIFGKTYDKIVGENSNIYYGGYYKSKDVYTDDGHVKGLPENYWYIKDLSGNHFALLLYLESSSNMLEFEKYTRKKFLS